MKRSNEDIYPFLICEVANKPKAHRFVRVPDAPPAGRGVRAVGDDRHFEVAVDFPETACGVVGWRDNGRGFLERLAENIPAKDLIIRVASGEFLCKTIAALVGAGATHQ